jgi:hypothetical protein
MPSPSGTPTLGLLLQTRNEARRIEAFLEHHRGFDGVLVVDMSSTDGTAELARRRGVPVLSVPHTGVCETHRQYALDRTPFDWVLILDADERLGAGGVELLREAIVRAADDVAGFELTRITFIGGVELKGCGYGAESLPRLVRPSRTRWPELVHARPELDGVLDPALARAGTPIIEHFGFQDVASLVAKIQAYSSREARELLDPALRGNEPRALRDRWAVALASELNHELRKRYTPELDGALAIWITWLMMSYRVMTWAKVWERDPAMFGAVDPGWFPRLMSGLFGGEHLHDAMRAAAHGGPSPADAAREAEARVSSALRERDAALDKLEQERAQRQALESTLAVRLALEAKRALDRAPRLKRVAKAVLERIV